MKLIYSENQKETTQNQQLQMKQIICNPQYPIGKDLFGGCKFLPVKIFLVLPLTAIGFNFRKKFEFLT